MAVLAGEGRILDQVLDHKNSGLEVYKFEPDSSNNHIEINQEDFLFSADYSRDGHDLIIVGKNGQSVILEGYFLSDNIADLIGPQGQVLRGEVVKVLAGPDNPGTYAQQGAAQGADPIGQVETLEGTASVQRTDGTVENLAVGTKVFQNDVLISDDGSNLSITFLDGTIFTLSDSSRMVLSELVFAPEDSNNSAVFNLVEGTFVFIAGEVAKTGDMEVKTPVATMGIRGTTVKVNIATDASGQATVSVSLNRDIDGSIGSIIFKNELDGSVTQITQVDSNWVINPADGTTREIARSDAELAADLVVINKAFDAVENAQDRLDQGETLVEKSETEGDDKTDNNNDENTEGENNEAVEGEEEANQFELQGEEEGSESGENTEEGDEQEQTQDSNPEGEDDASDSTPEDNDQTPENNNQPGDQSNLGSSGLNTASTTDTLQAITSLINTIESIIQQPISNIVTTNNNTNTQTPDAVTNTPNEPAIVVQQQPSPPAIQLPTLTGSVIEDGSVSLASIMSGAFTISNPSGNPLTATLTAGSTVSLPPGSGVTINTTNSVENPPGSGKYDVLVISGSASQLNTALNTLTYTPSANDDDGGTLSIVVSDGVNSATSVLTIGIQPVNDAPVTGNDALTVSEGSPITLSNVFFNDSDPDTGDTFSIAGLAEVTQAAGSTAFAINTPHNLTNGGTVQFQSNGQYIFDPNGAYEDLGTGETRQHTIQYTVQDSTGLQSSAQLTLTINGSNDAPVTVGANIATLEDFTANGQLTATDAENHPLTFALGSNAGDAPTNGTVTIQTNGAYTYTPNADFNGTDSFTYIASDGNGGVGRATINVTVNPANDIPVASNGNAATNEDSQLVGQLNATDIDGDPLTFAIGPAANHAPDHGTVVINTNGSYTYTPNANFNGNDNFTFRASDGNGGFDNGIISITVNSVSDAPVGVDKTVTINEDTSHTFTAGDFELGDPGDTPSDTLTGVRITTLPANGTLSLNGNNVSAGDIIPIAMITASNLVFTPGTNENGAGYASFTFQIRDNGSNGGQTEDQSPNTFTFNVTGTNDAPTATAPTVGPELITNGGFENGPDPAGGFTLVAAGQTTIPGWTIETGNIDHYTDQSFLNASEGDNAIDLNGLVPGAVSQTISTVVGRTYILTFKQSGDPADGETVGDIRVNVAGTDTDFSFTEPPGATRPNPGDITQKMSFTVTSTSTKITFTSLDVTDQNAGPHLDAVSVQQAPLVTNKATPLTLTGFSIADVDGGNVTVTFTSTGSGTFSFAAGANLANITGTTPANFSGSIADVNALVASFIQYTPAANFNGTETINLQINDGTAPAVSAQTQVVVLPFNTTVTGTSGDDGNLNGTANADLIQSLGTNNSSFQGDKLFGLAGNDTLVGGDTGSELFDGGNDDDIIITGNNNPDNGDYISGSLGNDRLVLTGITNGYNSIAYGNLTATLTSIIATINFTTNTGSIQKFNNTGSPTLIGTDTIIDVNKAIQSPNGGLDIRGSQQADTFNITSDPNGYIALMGGRGNDIFNLTSGHIRIEFRVEANGLDFFNRATQAANVDLRLANNQVINDGFGGTDDINFIGSFASGSGNRIELRGTDFTDTLIGDNGDNRFIGEQGNDTIDGQGGIDLIRFDRSGTASINIDLNAGTAVGYWDKTQINYTISNIEDVRGSNIGVDRIFGSSTGTNGGANNLDGRGGVDIINGRGGNDTLTGGNDHDVHIFDPANGNNTITDFVIGQDRIVIGGNGLTDTSAFSSFTFTSGNTVIDLGNGTTITVQGVNLVNVSNPEANFIFNELNSANSGTNTFNGSTANDFLVGTSGDDILNGNDGDDVIVGNGATIGYPPNTGDLINGGAGNDLIIADSGASTVIGGAGNDRIQMSQIVYVSDALNFDDWLAIDYSNSPAGIFANLSSITQSGRLAQTIEDGHGGTDTVGGVSHIFDSAFNDTFFVDGNDPSVNGSRGESVSISGGNDTVTFLNGNGRIDFGRATEGISWDFTTQTVTDINTANGNQIGTNTITGAVQVSGSNHNDTLTGNANNNRFRGRAGDDVINGGGGNNTVDHFSTANAITVDLTDNDGNGFEVDNDGHGGRDKLTNIQNVWGNLGADTITGNANANDLNGYANNDTINGGGGADTLNGGDGNDKIGVPNLGFTLANGGAGLDELAIIGGGQVLDFRGIGTNKINSIETLDLGIGDGATQVTLDEQNIINFSETFNPAVNTPDNVPGAGTNGTPLAASNQAILISGDASDILNLENSNTHANTSWQLAGNDVEFNVYNFTNGSTTFASVAVDDDVIVNTGNVGP